MVKEQRILKKKTQEELAEILDMTPRQIQRIEQNEERTRIVTLKRIIKALDITDKEIIKFMRK